MSANKSGDWQAGLCLLLCLLLPNGCRRGSSSPSENPSSQTAPPAEPTESISTNSEPHSGEITERKWIGEIPYDVFYDQPLAIAMKTTPITLPDATAGSSDNMAANSAPDPASSPEPTATTTGSSPTASLTPAPTLASEPTSVAKPSEMLPLPQLEEEVKKIRTRLTKNLQTVATFNRSQPAISRDGALLTAIAAVVSADKVPVNWETKAPVIRDLASEISMSAAGTGRGPFTDTKEPFEKILTMLDGGPPPADADADPDVPFGDIVQVADLMQHIETNMNQLKANINTDARLAENAEDAARDLHVLAMIAAIIADPSYTNSDQPDYQAFLKTFRTAAMEGATAAQNNKLSDFQSALNRLQTTCAECHGKYKSSNSGF